MWEREKPGSDFVETAVDRPFPSSLRSTKKAPPLSSFLYVNFYFSCLISLSVVCSSSKTLDHSKNLCDNEDFVPGEKGQNFVFYIKMEHPTDWVTWKAIAKCLKIWDLDVRGFHKSMWRLWIKGSHVLIVGCPASPYCNHKPAEVTPIFIPKKENEQS